MTIDFQKLRLDGVYQQNQHGDLMLRVKIPAGVISSEQAVKVCAIAERFTDSRLHLTCRGSIEIHNLRLEHLEDAGRMLAAVGLTSRGACGGAVRGIVCSTTESAAFPAAQSLVRRLHRHFAGNPHFEGLPKKFKIGVDGDYAGARHLIQDVGLVYRGEGEGHALYDVWTAGGLGREPQAAFLLAEGVPEERLLPLIEGIIRIFKAHTPSGKRLKHLLRSIGEAKFRELLQEQVPGPLTLESGGLGCRLTNAKGTPAVTAAIFAGEIETALMRRLATLAECYTGGFFALTAEQNLAFLPADAVAAEGLHRELAPLGLDGASLEQRVTFRICPGNHQCRMGLSPTRDLARLVLSSLGDKAAAYTWAISGCGNSCSQPQLADIGIQSSRLRPGDPGKVPLFTLYRRRGAGLGEIVAQDLAAAELVETLHTLI